eukprot:CAMPEP_0175896926 /NCGR_PEP_ID=MMETSP0108-20121206/434_1 /TAXON_ID=195067 ORGANISM="Goniomonas pacifica, Strain CCMP1869" /NCGR_SAMPLE_ID=MMETSP0108 /ASSEMBLY_ACC=CAM_ASM_000204 /LENGTH=184 /DNA_ID=CAMNT_0017218165 /DNA_START=10 /DNA_END=564 /DNA_ORIENTATION=-
MAKRPTSGRRTPRPQSAPSERRTALKQQQENSQQLNHSAPPSRADSRTPRSPATPSAPKWSLLHPNSLTRVASNDEPVTPPTASPRALDDLSIPPIPSQGTPIRSILKLPPPGSGIRLASDRALDAEGRRSPHAPHVLPTGAVFLGARLPGKGRSDGCGIVGRLSYRAPPTLGPSHPQPQSQVA